MGNSGESGPRAHRHDDISVLQDQSMLTSVNGQQPRTSAEGARLFQDTTVRRLQAERDGIRTRNEYMQQLSDKAVHGLSFLDREAGRAAGVPHDERISLIMRSILELTPLVPSKTNAIPLLEALYLTSQMSCLCVCVPGGGRRSSVEAALADMFHIPIGGWKSMCDVFGVEERAMYLTGRIREKSQSLGLPASVSPSLQLHLNPTGKSLWVSLRLRVRTFVPLYNKPHEKPSVLSEAEQCLLREWLARRSGLVAATQARCTVVPVTDSSGRFAAQAAVRFDYGFPWRPVSSANQLITHMSSKLMKAPNNALAVLGLYPVERPAIQPQPRAPATILGSSHA